MTPMKGRKLMVPVPSRLHGHRTREKPLHGVRVTVKDIIHLKGVETTGQSKSYGMLYDSPQPETASIISYFASLVYIGILPKADIPFFRKKNEIWELRAQVH